jgi:ESF2/ABP1 family protein
LTTTDIFNNVTCVLVTKKANKKKKNVTFTEGWVEFEKKKVAKWVVQNINNTPISAKKGSKFCDILWSMKYLPGFKWIHLSERLTYERAVYHQKLQIAISKARKEAGFFQDNLDKGEKTLKRKKKIKSQNKTS